VKKKYIRKYRKKEGKEAGKKDIGHEKLKKKGYKKERVNKKISYNHYIIIIFDLNSM